MNRPWMPLYIADYRADTAHLCAAEHGGYLLLIMHYWSTGGLPDDDKQLARIACMTPAEWRRARSTIEKLFQAGWKHKRIDAELAHAIEVSTKRRASAEQRYSKRDAIAPANAEQLETHSQSQPEKINSGANAPDAEASDDPRTRLFKKGLKTLSELTGRPPDSCRSLIGKWLKSVNDEAIHVIAAIEDAERNRVADPSAWITKVLTSKGKPDEKTVVAAADRLLERVRGFDQPAPGGIRDGAGTPTVRLLSKG